MQSLLLHNNIINTCYCLLISRIEVFKISDSTGNSISLRPSCPPLSFLIALFIAFGLTPTVTLAVCYGITVHRRRQMLNIERSSSSPKIYTESDYSSVQ